MNDHNEYDARAHHAEMTYSTPYTSRDGNTYWLRDGDYHRVDGPAVIFRDGSEQWCIFGELHRDDGPAIIDMDGHREWYHHGRIHRLDGPAMIRRDGHRDWYIDHERIPIVLCRVDGENIIFAICNDIDFSPYPSRRYKLGGMALDNTDLSLFLLTHTVVEMPYE